MKAIINDLKSYMAIIRISFKNNSIYRVDLIFKVISNIISISAYYAIWFSIYTDNGQIGNIDLSMLSTHYFISMTLTTVLYYMGNISSSIIDGTITIDLQKPIHCPIMHLCQDFGSALFDLIIVCIPAFIFSYLFLDILLPQSALNFILFIFSIFLSFLVFYLFSYTISLFSFWILKIDFLIQIKSALITILSGALVPIWFFPDFLQTILLYTPFETIYYIPEQIYLGNYSFVNIFQAFTKQVFWIVILALCCSIIWKKGLRKLNVAGG